MQAEDHVLPANVLSFILLPAIGGVCEIIFSLISLALGEDYGTIGVDSYGGS
jgi:succinate-acetate transporter protein